MATLLSEAPPGSVLCVDLEVSVPVVVRAMEAARRAGHAVVLDPSPAVRVTDEVLRIADFVTPNRHEAERLSLSAIASPESGLQAARKLHRAGAGAALVKLGANGCAVVSEGWEGIVSSPRVEAVDSTGAGDAFAAALCVAIAEGRGIREATAFAVAAAALAVSRYGAQAAAPAREEVEKAASLL